jgi:Ni,Fe-hydrogenase I large subunit
VSAAARKGKDYPAAVQHLVETFDPCMRCRLHSDGFKQMVRMSRDLQAIELTRVANQG